MYSVEIVADYKQRSGFTSANIVREAQIMVVIISDHDSTHLSYASVTDFDLADDERCVFDDWFVLQELPETITQQMRQEMIDLLSHHFVIQEQHAVSKVTLNNAIDLAVSAVKELLEGDKND